ncbi:MAG TPA: hypothetical protein VLH18_00805, partial [Candidatus Limnocylindrales bacterium]|nr:hypothetical protein [Candidatus Limnocylindrales bacterium]
MRKRTFIAVALAVVFVLALAAPVFAQSMTHSATYSLDGNVNLQRQAGHLCNTGAEMKQTITGIGKVAKTTSAAMIPGRLTVTDTNDIVTAPGAARNLAVISVIELCAPPKFTYEDHVVGLSAMYNVYDQPRVWGFGGGGFELTDTNDDVRRDDWETVNTSERQIWAASIEAAPGTAGTLNQKFEAAYGRYAGGEPLAAETPTPAADRSAWLWALNADGV